MEENNLLLLWIVGNKTFVGKHEANQIGFPPSQGKGEGEQGFYSLWSVYEMNKTYIPGSGFKIISTYCGGAEVKFNDMLVVLDKDSEYYKEHTKREKQREKEKHE